ISPRRVKTTLRRRWRPERAAQTGGEAPAALERAGGCGTRAVEADRVDECGGALDAALRRRHGERDRAEARVRVADEGHRDARRTIPPWRRGRPARDRL